MILLFDEEMMKVRRIKFSFKYIKELTGGRFILFAGSAVGFTPVGRILMPGEHVFTT